MKKSRDKATPISTITHDGINVMIDFGDGTYSAEIEQLYKEKYISEFLYKEALKKQEELDNKPF